jgi:hypothetical protein
VDSESFTARVCMGLLRFTASIDLASWLNLVSLAFFSSRRVASKSRWLPVGVFSSLLLKSD